VIREMLARPVEIGPEAELLPVASLATNFPGWTTGKTRQL